ncbi:MAG: DUF2934 domain-containing protein [Rhodoplanes sp.]
MDDHERRVRERAYRIWKEEGRPNGRVATHWEMASTAPTGFSAARGSRSKRPSRSSPRWMTK